ncbi:hypothetical protein EII29_11375, partial [Leptotrichia sp. OH3620_COT-345]|uniref:hemagglutinin repeat-containing protein n=1 Tax=Leptotrichia sp. OH3620_COT-345 TaxID=2491048 RepID=UPI000FA83126
GVSETVTVTKQIRDTKTIRHGGRNDYEKKIPYGPVRTVQVEELRHWDTLNKTKTVSGIIGEGGNTVLDSKRDLILQSSDIRGKDNIVLNAKQYILLLSTIDTEYKQRSQTTKRGGGLKKKKVTTEYWEEDNIYANNVDLTSEGNILFNFKEVDKTGNYIKGDNKGVLAQGVNFHSKGELIGFSDGDIFIEGTKDRLKSVYNSNTKKSWGGIGYGKSSSYVSNSRDRYKLSQLYNESGIRMDSEGKLKVVGAIRKCNIKE